MLHLLRSPGFTLDLSCSPTLASPSPRCPSTHLLLSSSSTEKPVQTTKCPHLQFCQESAALSAGLSSPNSCAHSMISLEYKSTHITKTLPTFPSHRIISEFLAGPPTPSAHPGHSESLSSLSISYCIPCHHCLFSFVLGTRDAPPAVHQGLD